MSVSVPYPSASDYDGVPQLVEPEIRRLDGEVREVSVPSLVAPPIHGSLADLPFDNADAAPDARVLSRRTQQGHWADVTAMEFAAQVMSLAKGLISEGLVPGDRIAVMARTIYEWTLLDFAAWAAGLVTVPIYPTSSVFQTRWILQDSGAVALVTETVGQAAALGPELNRLPDLRHMWVVEKGHLERLAELGAPVPEQEVAVRRGMLVPDTLATVIYTSGTTGRPKGCVLTHGNFLAEVDNATELLYPIFKSKSTEDPATLLFLPMSHVFGRMVAIACIRARVRLGHAPGLGRGSPPGRPRHVPPDLPPLHPLHAGEDLQQRARQGGDRRPCFRLRPCGECRRPLRRGDGGPPRRHGLRPGRRTEDVPRLLRPARLPPYPQRHGRQDPPPHLRRLPARPPPRGLLRGRGHGDLRGVRPHRVHRRRHRHPTPQTPPGHGRLADARHQGPYRGRRRDPAQRRPGLPRLLGPAAAAE